MNSRPLLWPALGAVRFFLALIVAGSHVVSFVPGSDIGQMLVKQSGFAAVLGFLVISGFSIAASHEKQPAGFYGRRALRILPLYFLAVIASSLVPVWFGGPIIAANGTRYYNTDVSSIVQNLFFLQGFTVGHIMTNGVVWTLSIEVALYLLTPLFARLSQTSLVLIAGTSLALYLIAPLFDTPYCSGMIGGGALALLAWPWLAGFIAYRHKDHLTAAMVLLGVFVAALSINSHDLAYHWPVPVTLVALAIGFGGRLRAPRWLCAALVFLGDASYPLYLFHLPVFLVLYCRHFTGSGAAYIAAAVVVSIGLDWGYDRQVKHVISACRAVLAKPLAAPA